jgi:hypothetical protein
MSLAVSRPHDACAESAFAGEFLTLGVGARALAMGGGYGALSDDATALYWNPAGLGQVARRTEATFMHSSLFGLDSYDTVNVAKSFGNATWGFQWLRVAVDEIAITTVSDQSSPVSSVNRPTEARTESVSSQAFAAGMGRRVAASSGERPRIEVFVGGAGKILFLTSGAPRGTNAFGVGGDIGALGVWHPVDSTEVRAAVNAQDFFRTSLYWNTVPAPNQPSHKDTILQNVKTAVGFVVPVPPGESRLTLHAESDSRNDFELHTGAEWFIGNTLALRVGMQERKSDAATLRDLTAGAGFRLGFTGGQSFRVDYAFTGHDLGDSHRLSLGVQF